MNPVFPFQDKICFNSLFGASDRNPSNLTKRANFIVRVRWWVHMEPKVRIQLDFWSRWGRHPGSLRGTRKLSLSISSLSQSLHWIFLFSSLHGR